MSVNIETDEKTIPWYAEHTDLRICGFFGEYRWLSNFYPCPVTYGGQTFPSSENAYQAAKFPNRTDRLNFYGVTAAASKKLGRKAPLIPEEWDKVKLDIMREIVFNKFLKNEDLRLKLLETGDKYLEETNSWKDMFWGVHSPSSNIEKKHSILKIGKNELGMILMGVRAFWQGSFRKHA